MVIVYSREKIYTDTHTNKHTHTNTHTDTHTVHRPGREETMDCLLHQSPKSFIITFINFGDFY